MAAPFLDWQSGFDNVIDEHDLAPKMPADDTAAPSLSKFPAFNLFEWEPVTIIDIWKKYFGDATGYKSTEAGVAVITDQLVSGTMIDWSTYRATLGVDAKLFVFVSGDGVKLLQAYNACQSVIGDDEVVLFIEDNTGDAISPAVQLMLIGKSVKADALDTGWAENIAKTVQSDTHSSTILNKDDVDKLFKALQTGTSIRTWLLTKFVQGAIVIERGLLSEQIAFFSGISSGISNLLRIDEKHWNPAVADASTPIQNKTAKDAIRILADKIQEIASPPKGLQIAGDRSKGLSEAAMAEAAAEAAKVHSAIEAALTNGAECSFAFICGFWNSFVDLLTSIFDLVALVLKAMLGSFDVLTDPFYYFALLLEFQDNLMQYIAKIDWAEVLKQSILFELRLAKYVVNSLPKILPAILQPAIVGYCAGYISFLVLDYFIPILDLTLIARVLRVVKTGAEVFLETLLTVMRKVLNIVEEVAEPGLEVLMKAINTTLAKLKLRAGEIGKFFEHLWEVVVKWINEFIGSGGLANKLEQGLDKPFFETAGYVVTKVETLEALYGQSKSYTCVATSLRMALESKGVMYSEEYIARALGTTEDGARLLDIPEALENLYQSGIKTVAEKRIRLSELAEKLEEGDRAIVSIVDNERNYHAVIIDGIKDGKVIIRDPLPQGVGSSYEIGVKDFEELFSRKAVIIKK